jgi:hypothetical protein
MFEKKSFLTILLGTLFSAALLVSDATVEIYFIDGPTIALTHTLYVLAAAAPISGIIFLSGFFTRLWMLLTNSALLTFGILSLNLNFHSEVILLPFLQYAGLAAVIGGLAIGFMAALTSESVPVRRAVIMAAVLILLSPLPVRLFAGDSNSERLPHEDTSGLTEISFTEKPNIYLLAIDSLIPLDVARDYMGFSDLPYYKLLGVHLNEVPMTLSFQVPSGFALNSLMRLSQSSQPSRLNYFEGGSTSLLSQVAERNGYRLITGWPGYVPRFKRGPSVFKMIEPKLSTGADSSFICNDRSSRKVIMRSFFYCRLVHQYSSAVEIEPYRDMVLRFISEDKNSLGPFILFTYVYSPIGHTPIVYDHTNMKEREEYRNFFYFGANEAGKFLNSALDAVRANDPNAIVLVFGDHGAWLSRGITASDDPEFFYRDRHRIFFASMIGSHKCNSPDRVYSAGRYNTPSRFLVDVLICLQGNKVEINPDFEEDQDVLRYVVDR